MTPARRREASEEAARARALTERMLADCLGLRARLVSRAITRGFEEEFRASDLSGPQFFLLAAISHLGPIPRSRLAEALRMERSTLHRNLEALERAGWVELVDVAGTRGLTVKLRPAGRRKLLALEPAWERGQARARELLGERAADDLGALGSRLLERRREHGS